MKQVKSLGYYLEKYDVGPVFIHLADLVIIEGIIFKDRYNVLNGVHCEKQSETMPKRIFICMETPEGYKRVYYNFTKGLERYLEWKKKQKELENERIKEEIAETMRGAK